MSLLFADSFEAYGGDITDILRRWDSNSQNPAFDTGVKRNGSYSLKLVNATFEVSITKNLPAASATVIVGFGFRTNTVSSDITLFRIKDGSTVHGALQITNTGALKYYRGDAVTLLGTSSNTLSANTWYYIELKVTIDDSAGVVTLKVDETAVLSLTSQDTRNGGNASADRVQLVNGSGSSSWTYYFDDFYLCDSGGSTNNDFLGAIVVEWRVPSGAGNAAVWTPSAGSNYACVDDGDPNDDTDYISSAVNGDKDTYAMTDLATVAGSVKGVIGVALAKKTDANPATLNLVVRSGGADYNGSDYSPGTSYDYTQNVWETNPNGSVAWTIATVNAMEMGVRNNT